MTRILKEIEVRKDYYRSEEYRTYSNLEDMIEQYSKKLGARFIDLHILPGSKNRNPRIFLIFEKNWEEYREL